MRRAAQPGAALLLADFWTNPAHTEPLQAALMAGEFAAHIRTGDVYSVDEARVWLDHTGRPKQPGTVLGSDPADCSSQRTHRRSGVHP